MKTCRNTGKPIIEISHSGLSSFASCPKKFAFRKLLVHFENQRRGSDATDVGSALHEGLQEYMRSRDEDKALEIMALHHPIDLRNPEKAAQYSLEAVAHTMLHALHNQPVDSAVGITDYDLAYFDKGTGVLEPGTEIAFLVEIELEHLMFHQRGFIDLVLRSPINGRYLAVDIKTTTPQGVRNFQTKYKWDWQVTSYGIPLNALLGEFAEFEVGIFGVVLSDREPATHFPTFRRQRADIESYQFYLLDKCRQIQHYWLQGRFPRHPTACVSFNQPCYFINDCQAETLKAMQMQVNPSMKAGDYEERPFNPVFTVKLEGM